MSFLKASTLFLHAALVLSAALTAQGDTPPKKPTPPTPPLNCVMMILVHVPGQNRVYAKVLLGKDWTWGCLGPAGSCYIPTYVPC